MESTTSHIQWHWEHPNRAPTAQFTVQPWRLCRCVRRSSQALRQRARGALDHLVHLLQSNAQLSLLVIGYAPQ